MVVAGNCSRVPLPDRGPQLAAWTRLCCDGCRRLWGSDKNTQLWYSSQSRQPCSRWLLLQHPHLSQADHLIACLVSTALAACVTISSASWSSIRSCVPAADFSLAAMEGIIGDLTRMTAERDRSESAALHVSHGSVFLHMVLSTCRCSDVAASLRCPVHEWGTSLCLELFGELCAGKPTHTCS